MTQLCEYTYSPKSSIIQCKLFIPVFFFLIQIWEEHLLWQNQQHRRIQTYVTTVRMIHIFRESAEQKHPPCGTRVPFRWPLEKLTKNLSNLLTPELLLWVDRTGVVCSGRREKGGWDIKRRQDESERGREGQTARERKKEWFARCSRQTQRL